MTKKKTAKKTPGKHKFQLRFDDKNLFKAVSKAANEHKDSINKYINRLISDNPAVKKALEELSTTHK